MDTQHQSDAGMVVRENVPSSDTVRVRFGEIDGLRALAIVAVLVFEATRLASPSGTWPGSFARIFADAGQALSLFFLISGFVLAYPALAARREDGRTYLDVGRYLVKRILRIYPAYLVVLGLTIVVPALALQYGLPALAAGSPGLGLDAFARNALFLWTGMGSGLGNDGFRVLGLEARWYLLFPALLWLWVRAPRVFVGFAVVAAGADLLLAAAHGAGIGSLLPFMLGIVAADVRAGHLRFERMAFIVAGIAAVAAVVAEPFVALLPGAAGATGALRTDPLWSVAFFGLLVGAGTSGAIERVLSLRPLRLIGAASFGIALVMVPVSSFIVRQVLSTFGQAAAATNAVIFSLLCGVVIWQLADRWFGAGNLRRDVAAVVGPLLDAVLRIVRVDRVMLGSVPMDASEQTTDEDVDATFYAPPPRPGSGDLAVVSMRSGSPEDLAAEIIEMKKRLSDRSTAIFAESEGGTIEAEATPVEEPPVYAKPGFYRRTPATPATPAASTPPPAAPTANVRPYAEPQPISLSFEAAQPPAPPRDLAPPSASPPPAREYEHYTFEPTPPLAPPERPQAATPQAPPPAPNNRGPIKMRLGPIGEPVAASNGNGKHHKVNGLDG